MTTPATTPGHAMPNDRDPAVEAFHYGLPLAEMTRLRAATSPRRIEGHGFAGAAPDSQMRWCNVFIHDRELLGAGKSRVVTPNHDTLYSNAWLDLGDGPLVLDVPDTDGRFYVLGLLDFFTNPFASIGQRRTGTRARSFAVVGPDWQGELPAPFADDADAVVRAPTRWVWLIGRVLVEGAADVAAVRALQDRFALRPLGALASAPKRFDAGIDSKAPLTAERFQTIVAAALRENPPPAAEREASVRCLSVNAHRLADAMDEAQQRLRDAAAAGNTLDGWTRPTPIGPSFSTDYFHRALVAHQFIGALESRDAMYPMAHHDADGRLLDAGTEGYRLQFSAVDLPPVDAFWSLTLYDSTTRMLVDNAIDRYTIGDRTEGLAYDANGGLTITIQHQPPDDPAAHANWLPAPAGRFYLCLRAYSPRAELIDGRYRLPPILRILNPASD